MSSIILEYGRSVSEFICAGVAVARRVMCDFCRLDLRREDPRHHAGLLSLWRSTPEGAHQPENEPQVGHG